MRRQIPSLEEIAATRAAATEKLLQLRTEAEALPAKIAELEASMLTDLERDPAEILAEIQEARTQMRNYEIQIARAESQRLEAEIAQALAPLEALQTKLEEAYLEEDAANEGVTTANATLEAAKQRVRQLQHDIQNAERKAQQAEIVLSKHRQTSRAALAA